MAKKKKVTAYNKCVGAKLRGKKWTKTRFKSAAKACKGKGKHKRSRDAYSKGKRKGRRGRRKTRCCVC